MEVDFISGRDLNQSRWVLSVAATRASGDIGEGGGKWASYII